jgi:hypothetical protein
MRAVLYPTLLSHVATVLFSKPSFLNHRAPFSPPLPSDKLWLWAYWPLSIVAREGQQTGSVRMPFSKVVPFPISSLCTVGICSMLSAS